MKVSGVLYSGGRQFFCRGGRGRLRATSDGWDEWRKRDRWRRGCAIIEGPCAVVRAGVVPEFLVPNRIFASEFASLPLGIRRPCFPSRVPCLECDTVWLNRARFRRGAFRKKIKRRTRDAR